MWIERKVVVNVIYFELKFQTSEWTKFSLPFPLILVYEEIRLTSVTNEKITFCAQMEIELIYSFNITLTIDRRRRQVDFVGQTEWIGR